MKVWRVSLIWLDFIFGVVLLYFHSYFGFSGVLLGILSALLGVLLLLIAMLEAILYTLKQLQAEVGELIKEE